VQIHDDSKRLFWKLAVVEELIYAKDGLLRAAIIRTSNDITNRPVTKLYPLEFSTNNYQLRKSEKLKNKNNLMFQEIYARFV